MAIDPTQMIACRKCGALIERRLMMAHHHKEHPKPKVTDDAVRDDEPVAPTVVEQSPVAGEGELTPVEPAKRRWRDRRRSGREPAPATGHPKEKRPKRATKRVPTAPLLADTWRLLAFPLVQFGIDPPVGRAMAFQADAAGEILESLTRDTFLEEPLQRIAAKEQDLKALGNLVALPVLVGLYERAPDETREMIEPFLIAAVKANFVAMVPAVKRMKAQEKAFNEALEEMGFTFAEGTDPVRDLLVDIFSQPEPEPVP